jgi:transposase-like protein
MKRTRFTGEQIIGILDERGAGATCAELCRKHGMSDGTFHDWRARFGGMTVPGAGRLKALADENTKLKKLLAEQMLDMAAMKELLSRNGDSRREARGCRASEGPARAVGTAGVRACGEDRKMVRHRSQRAPDSALRGRLRDLSNERRRFGYRRLFVLLRREGKPSGDQPHLPALPRGRADRAQTKGTPQGCRDTGADPGRGAGQRALAA